jgi:hypothetical protein
LQATKQLLISCVEGASKNILDVMRKRYWETFWDTFSERPGNYTLWDALLNPFLKMDFAEQVEIITHGYDFTFADYRQLLRKTPGIIWIMRHRSKSETMFLISHIRNI